MEKNLSHTPAVAEAIAKAIKADVSATALIHFAAKAAAKAHGGVAANVIQALYAPDFKSASRNLRQQFAASLVCACAGSVLIEVSPPAEGKAAKIVAAKDLTTDQAKRFASEVRAEVAKVETEKAMAVLTPAELAEAKAKAEADAKAKAEAEAKAKAEAVEAADANSVKWFLERLGNLSTANREALDTGLLAFGLKLVKDKSAPKAMKGGLADLATMMMK